MSRSKKDRRGGPLDHQDISLLGAAFNLPTRRTIELAERRAAVAAAQASHQIKISYKGGKDTHVDTFETSSSSSDDDDDDDDDDCEEDDSDLALLARQRRDRDGSHKKRNSSVIRKPERQVTRQQQPSTQSSKRKKLTKSRSLSTQSTKSFSPPIASLVSPSATFPSFRCSGTAAPSRSLEHHRRPQAPFALAPDPGPSSVQIMRRAPPAMALPYPIIAPAQALPSGIVAQQIQRIQAEIDSKVAMLSRDAGNGALRDELTALQIKLNSTLNTVLDAKKRSARQPSRNVAEEQQPLLEDQANPASSQSRLSKRDESPERPLRHHLCSGCGTVRSSQFHEKHPVAPGEKPILNYCKSCRGTTTSDGEGTGRLLQQYHFCFGCGIVRSKKFQRKNPRSGTGDGSALPNYCGKCTREIQAIVGIAEASAVMDLGSDFSNQDEEESWGTCSVEVQASSDITPEAASPQTQSELSPDTAEFPGRSPPNASQASRKRNSYGLSQAKRRVAVKPRNLTQSSPPRGPASLDPSPSTPPYRYCPDRRSGSAQRRAQRSPLASISGSRTDGPIGAENVPAQPYRAPYVEDVPSPETKQPKSKHRIPARHSFERVSDPQTYHKKRQTSVTKGESTREISAAEAARKTVKSKADLEVHFWDSPLSGEISSDEDSQEGSTGSDGAQGGHDHTRGLPRMNDARSQSQSSQQQPPKSSNFKNASHEAQTHPIADPPEQQDDTTRFWKGAFAKRERGEAGAWANHIPAAPERHSSPSSPSHSASSSSYSSFAARHSSRSQSPLEAAGLPVFPPSEPFNPLHDDDAPPLRTSKGAFGSSAFKTAPFFTHRMFGETRPSSPLSSSRSKSNSRQSSHRRDESGDHSGVKPRLGPTSSFANFGCKFDSECFAVRDEDEVPLMHGYSDFSHLCGGGGGSGFSHNHKSFCPNPNPYYIPRKSTFTGTHHSHSSWFRRRSCRSRAGDGFGNSNSWASKRTTPEWIPEPIIEEPSSPMSSPVQCVMLLEFHNHSGTASPVPPLSEASTESTEPDILEISDIE